MFGLLKINIPPWIVSVIIHYSAHSMALFCRDLLDFEEPGDLDEDSDSDVEVSGSGTTCR